MIDVSLLELVAPTAAPPGSLLIHCAKQPLYPALLTVSGGGPRNTLVIADDGLGFEVVDMARASGVFLKVAKPRFVVDPESAVTGFDHTPEPGTLFLTSAGAGILARADHAECGVMLDGTMTGIDYAKFAGFRAWRIEIDGADDKPHVLYSHRAKSLGQAD